MSLKVFGQLEQALGARQRKTENLTDYVERLIRMANDLPDEKWDELSEEVQGFVNEGINVLNTAANLVEFTQDNVVEDMASQDEEIEKMRGSGRAVHSRELNRRRNYQGAGYRAKEVMLERGVNITAKQIYEILAEEGYHYSQSTLNVVRAEFRRGLNILWDKGFLKKKPKGFEPRVDKH